MQRQRSAASVGSPTRGAVQTPKDQWIRRIAAGTQRAQAVDMKSAFDSPMTASLMFAAPLLIVSLIVPRAASAQDTPTPEMAIDTPADTTTARGSAGRRRGRPHRTTQRLDQRAVERLLRASVETSLAPCDVAELDFPPSLILPAGAATVASLATAPRASGRITAPLIVTVGDAETRVLVSARVVCPAPVVAAGARVRIVVVIGAVRASAPGIVAQPGRIGDEVRVTNIDTRVQLRGRVVDAGTVEVRP